MFLHFQQLIDKPSKGFDKWFFVLRIVIFLRCRLKGNVCRLVRTTATLQIETENNNN